MGSAVHMNLGALPQLECWNTGMMEDWVLGIWKNELLIKFMLTGK